MARLILGILAAPVLWGIVSVPVNLVVAATYGDAVTAPPYPLSFLLLSLALSLAYSLVAGYGAAWIAGTGALKLGIGAGIALLAVGAGVQIAAWEALPVWYHIVFLALLIPLCVLGARLRSPD